MNLLDWAGTALVAPYWWTVEHLPVDWAHGLAPFVGTVKRLGRKNTVIHAMKSVLGDNERTKKEWNNLWRSYKQHIGLTLIEWTRWNKTTTHALGGMISLSGEKHLQNALNSGKGAMLFLSHMGNSFMSLVAGLGSRGYNVSLARNTIPPRLVEQRIEHMYSRFGAKSIRVGDGVPLQASRTFKQNGVFAVAFDFSTNGKRKHWLRLGCSQMNVSIAPAIIAIRNRVAVLCITCTRLKGRRHQLTIHPPLPYSTTGEIDLAAIALTQQAINLLEDEIRKKPHQWWIWNRVPLQRTRELKISPDPAPSLVPSPRYIK